jgi:hypothetical protein
VSHDGSVAVPQRSGAFQGVSDRSDSSAHTRIDETNPPRRLRPRELAAARLLVRGLRTAEVARELTTTPQTINRWKREPVFSAELRRLHDLIVSSTPAAKVASAPARPPADRNAPRYTGRMADMRARIDALISQTLP